MRPVRTAHSNLVYVGPPGVADLHCERVQRGVIRSVWHLTEEEPRAIAAGAGIALTVFREPVPPVALEVTFEQGIGEDAPEALDRLEQLRRGGVL